MLSHSIKFSEVHTKEKGGNWLTRGELEQRCGVEEATRKIEEGKYEGRSTQKTRRYTG